MLSFTRSALILALAGGASASFEAIAGYEPASTVTDHNAIDRDQALIQTQLDLNTVQSYQIARAVYEEGAFSKVVATVTLSAPLTAVIAEDTELIGKGLNGMDVAGTLLKEAAVGATTIQFQYNVNKIQAQYVGCQAGANPDPNTAGCLDPNGVIAVAGSGTPLSYTTVVNGNERTIQGFSTGAKAKMFDCINCPYRTYEKFYNYYNQFDYADQWVIAAFEGKATGSTNGKADFSQYGNAGKEQAIKKGTAYMNVWMYIIRQLEDALDDCKEDCALEGCNDDPVHSWDEGVAFYTGSLEGKDGAGEGVLIYDLADKRCANFKTCGDLADTVTGTSHVNFEIFREFTNGLRKLKDGKCAEARLHKERIEELMAIPLIQGTLRYAYIVSNEASPSERANSEGAAFAAAVLPLVHACDEEDAEEIYNNMAVGAASTDFAAVKNAFERRYECMGLRAADVGGLWDSANNKYFDGAAPPSSVVSIMPTIMLSSTPTIAPSAVTAKPAADPPSSSTCFSARLLLGLLPTLIGSFIFILM